MSRRILQKSIKIIENKTFWFLFPMLGNHRIEFDNFRGCFIGDTDYPQYTSHLFLLISWDPSLEFRYYEDRLKGSPHYVKSYQPDKFHTMFIFKVPMEYEEDYDLILAGKYSKISPTYKKHIVKFHNIRGLHQLPQILYKDPRLKKELEEVVGQSIPEENELSSIFDLEKEVYSEDKKIITPTPNIDIIP